MSKSSRYEEQLKENADKAFEELPPENEEETKAAHRQLMSWLINMGRSVSEPGTVASFSMANTACNAFEAVIHRMVESTDGDSQKKWKSLQKAVSALDDSEQLGLLQSTLAATLGNETDAILVTRKSDAFFWEQTGFHIDGDTRCAFAKVGNEKFQPIGFDDGSRYIGTQGSKTLWLRDFAMAILVPYAPAFKIERKELDEKLYDENMLTDKEIFKINEALEWFEGDLVEFNKTDSESEEALEITKKMRETIKLARIRLPRFDDHLDKLVEEHPEVGANFENVAAEQVVASSIEYLRFIIDEDTARKDVAETVLLTGDADEQRHALLKSIISALSDLIPKEGSEPDGSAIISVINAAALAIPEIRLVFEEHDPASNALDAAKAALIWLHQQLEE